MNYTRYTDSPKTDDTIGFTLETYGDDGVLRNPYSVETITIYYVEKNNYRNERVLEIKHYKSELETIHDNLQEVIQTDPSEKNLADLSRLKRRMEETAITNRFYYSDAKIVIKIGSPVWNGEIKNIVNLEDGDNNPINGKFIFLWKPTDRVREGTYFIRWDWRNEKGKQIRSAEKLFTLHPSESKINSIYSKFAPREKYNVLFDRYIPKMYRVKTTPNDITPEVLVNLNKSVGQSMLELDDLAVGLIDMFDPTFIPEGFLPVMANFFDIELRSKSSTAWRNQVKHAMPLFKKKGSLEGLREALDKANVRLIKLTNLWQVVSPYTWTDGFVIDKDGSNNDIIGHLSKRPINKEFEITIKSAETHEYFLLPNNMAYLQEVQLPEPSIAVIWNGSNGNPPIKLFKGDVVRINYKYKNIPEDAKTIENYIESLPLADQRDERSVKYPLKNWNVKLIEEDDPLFNLLIPDRNAFQNPVVYGKIRTTFLYSEKAFNMDTYNGSLYSSNNPCDMDKNFTDPCSGGQSSKFNIHLEIDEVTDEKIREVKEIITDYCPFHAILHNMKISSKITDLVLSPIEKIKSEVRSKQKTDNVEKIGCTEAIYCEIKYKDGRRINGRMV